MQSDEPDAHEKTRPNAGDSVLQVDQSGTGDASSPDAALSASIPATAKSFAAGFAAAFNGTIIDNPHARDRYPWQQHWSDLLLELGDRRISLGNLKPPTNPSQPCIQVCDCQMWVVFCVGCVV